MPLKPSHSCQTTIVSLPGGRARPLELGVKYRRCASKILKGPAARQTPPLTPRLPRWSAETQPDSPGAPNGQGASGTHAAPAPEGGSLRWMGNNERPHLQRSHLVACHGLGSVCQGTSYLQSLRFHPQYFQVAAWPWSNCFSTGPPYARDTHPSSSRCWQ